MNIICGSKLRIYKGGEKEEFNIQIYVLSDFNKKEKNHVVIYCEDKLRKICRT